MPTNTNSSGGPVTTGGAFLASAAPKGFRLKLSQMIAGLQAVLPDGSSVTVNGQVIAKTDLVTEMTKVMSAFQAVDAATLATKGARSQLRTQLPGFQKQFLDLKDGLVSFLGRGNPQLAQFGMTAAKPAKPLSPEAKVVRTQKALKTRALRHTMGKKQKAAVQYGGDLKVSVNETTLAGPTNGPAPTATPVVTQGTVVAAAPVATPVPAISHTQ